MYKLLALGGPKDMQWLPWDGTQEEYKVPIIGEKELFFKPEEIEANDIPDMVEIASTKYFVYTMYDSVKEKSRRVYVNETVPSPKDAQKLLEEHLMSMFIGVGDLLQ